MFYLNRLLRSKQTQCDVPLGWTLHFLDMCIYKTLLLCFCHHRRRPQYFSIRDDLSVSAIHITDGRWKPFSEKLLQFRYLFIVKWIYLRYSYVMSCFSHNNCRFTTSMLGIKRHILYDSHTYKTDSNCHLNHM